MLFPNSMQPSLSNSGPPTIPVMNSTKNNFGTMLVYNVGSPNYVCVESPSTCPSQVSNGVPLHNSLTT